MITKICSKCKKELPLELFGKEKRGKYGVRSVCRECTNKDKKEYREQNKDKIKVYWQTNKERFSERKKNYYKNNKEKINAKCREYYYTNIEKEKERHKQYRNTHQKEIIQYRENNKEKHKEYSKVYNMLIQRKYCIDGQEEAIENYELAKNDNFVGWDRHHRLETHNSDGQRRIVDLSAEELKALDMYYNRPAEELIWLRSSEHLKLHWKGKKCIKELINEQN